MNNNIKNSIKIDIKDNKFIFISELIDITFIKLNQETIDYINPYFLCSTKNDSNIHDSILIFQYYYMEYHSKILKFTNGTIRHLHGFNYYHGISIEFGLYDSPLLNKNFEVVDVHKSRKPKSNNAEEDMNVATKYSEIEYSITVSCNKPERAKQSVQSLDKKKKKKFIMKIYNSFL